MVSAAVFPVSRAASVTQTVRKLPEFGVKQREERAVRESERLGLIGRLTRPKRRPGPQCAQIEPPDPPQAATAAVMASTPRMLSARRKLQASAVRLNSARTFARPRIRKSP